LGLAWGGYAWLAFLALNAACHACAIPIEPRLWLALGWKTPAWLHAGVWLTVLGLTWTRHARRGIALGIGAQAILGTLDALTTDAGSLELSFILILPWWWTLTCWVPISLALVPLLVVGPISPRRTLALILLGRYAWPSQ
jgi:hypothetical protein